MLSVLLDDDSSSDPVAVYSDSADKTEVLSLSTFCKSVVDLLVFCAAGMAGDAVDELG